MSTTARLSADVDRLLDYPTGWELHPIGRCRLRVWHEAKVAVVTEVDDNPGPSVTNAAEHVAAAVEEAGYPLAAVGALSMGEGYRFVEHYPGTAHRSAIVDRVWFSGRRLGGQGFYDPRWRHIEADDPNLGWLRAALEAG